MSFLPELPDDYLVMVEFQDRREPSTILHPTDDPRSYLVDTSSGIVRRNRHHLIPLPQTTPSTSESESPPLPESCIETSKDPSPSRSPIVTRSCSRALKKGKGDVDKL